VVWMWWVCGRVRGKLLQTHDEVLVLQNPTKMGWPGEQPHSSTTTAPIASGTRGMDF
jgi:hypothetical protein